MLGMEAWAFEAMVIMAGIIGTKQLDAHAIMMTITSLTYVAFPLGLSIAVSIRVGNLIGSRNPKQARLSGYIGLTCCALFMTCVACVQFGLKDYLGYIFISDEGVVKTVARIAPICTLFQLLDGTAAVAGGVGPALSGWELPRCCSFPPLGRH